jgi:hypothetical protein
VSSPESIGPEPSPTPVVIPPLEPTGIVDQWPPVEFEPPPPPDETSILRRVLAANEGEDSGSTSSRGRWGGTPNPNPASEEGVPSPDAPAPQSVLEGAAETGKAMNQMFGGKNRGIPDIGKLIITDSEGNFVYSPDSLYWGEGPVSTHVEGLAVNDATDWLLDNATEGKSYAVHVITEYEPCKPHAGGIGCSTLITSGYWADQLYEAAASRGANAGLFIWWHRNNGIVQSWP